MWGYEIWVCSRYLASPQCCCLIFIALWPVSRSVVCFLSCIPCPLRLSRLSSLQQLSLQGLIYHLSPSNRQNTCQNEVPCVWSIPSGNPSKYLSYLKIISYILCINHIAVETMEKIAYAKSPSSVWPSVRLSVCSSVCAARFSTPCCPGWSGRYVVKV